MAAELQAQGVHLRLNTPVTAISTTSTTTSSSNGSDGGGSGGSMTVTVRASAGGEEQLVVQASCLVVALSPPLWTTIAWSPPLSPAKQAVAQRMYMGAAVKTIAVYRYGKCFWRPSEFKTQGQLEDLGPVANLFPSTVDGAPALVGLVTAGAAKAFAELPEGERRARVLEQYRRYFGSGQAVDGCVAFHSKDWVHEPFSRGCYAALMPPGLATSVGKAVRAPEGRVCFAGTELAMSWPGYFEGALDAGFRAAREVVALLDAGQGSERSGEAAGEGAAAGAVLVA